VLQKLITYFQFGNRFCGIEHSSKNGSNYVYATGLKRYKASADIEFQFEADSITNLAKKLPKKQHAFLVVNNEQVLTKSVQTNQQEPLNIIQQVFPNIDLDDFFYEIISENNTHFVSICRQDYIKELIQNYKANHIYIINIALGSLLTSSIKTFTEESIITTAISEVKLENNHITSIENIQTNITKNYNINGLKTNSNYILSLSGALSSLLNHFKSHSNSDLFKNKLLTNFKQVKFFNQFIKLGLTSILLILLINFFVFNNFFTRVQVLNETSQINQVTKNKVISLNEIINKKQKIVEDILRSNSSKSSFYVNAIIESLPKSVLLSELNYQPLLRRIKEDEIIELDENLILISGESNNSNLYSNWISNLERINWVNKAETTDYTNINSNTSSFKLEIMIIHDK